MRIFAALKQAGADNRLDIAEHLLRALEVLDGEPSAGARPQLRRIPGGEARQH
jgi:hypothetical protein